MDELGAMRLFLRVTESGSFSAAGRRLGMAPSSVSRQLGGLEDSLGVRLLNRTTRRLSLTEAGRLYHERAERILADVDEAIAAVAYLHTSPRGLLRINVPLVFGRLHVVPALAAFLRQYPDVRIDLVLTDHFVNLVEEGVDVAIRVGELADSSLIAGRLAPNRRVICASPAYIARHGEPKLPDDLSRHHCLVYKMNLANATWRLQGPEGEIGVAVSGPLQANDLGALYAAVLEGLGLGLLPTWLVGDCLRSGELVGVLGDYQATATGFDTAIHAVFPQARQLSAKVRAFVDFMAARFSPRPPWEAPPATGSG